VTSEGGIDASIKRLGGIFHRHCRRGNKLVEGLVVNRLQIAGLFERGTVSVDLCQARFDTLRHFVKAIFGGREIARRCGDLFDRARRRIRSELDELRDEIERFFIIGVGDQHMRARPIIDVLQEGDEGLALSGFAIAPADQCGNKQEYTLRCAQRD